MRSLLKIFAFCLLAQTAQAQCDTTGILLELQATTDLQGIIFANDRCLTTLTVLAPLYVNGDTLSIDTTGLGGGGGGGVGLDTLVALPPAAGFTIAGSPAQNSRDTITFSLANDLAALEALSGTGIIARTAAETYALRTITAGTGISIADGNGVSGNPTITNTGDLSATNEIQQIDTFEIASNVLRASLSSDGVPFKSVDLSPYVNVATDLTFTGASSPYTLNSSTGTDVTLTQGSGITITRSSNDLSFAATDASTTNEVQTYAHTGTTSYTNTLDLGGGSFTLQAAGILAISHTAGTVTLTATEAQVANNGLSDNENSGNFRLGNSYMNGSDGPFLNDRKINLNAFRLYIGDNTDSTLLHIDGTNDRVGIHTTAPGRTFTVNGEAEIKDLVTTNPTLLVGADGNGVLSEVTLGSGLSFSGTTLNVSAGSNYQTWRDDGVAATQRANANFVSTSTVTMTLTDDAGNTETEVTANVPTDGITATQIAAGAVGTSEIATGGVATADIADDAVTYAKIQNAAANNVLLGNNNGALSDYEELNATAVQTMLGYVDVIALANQQIAYGSDANTITSEPAFLYDATNDRQTINCTTPGLGAGAAILNLANVGTDGTGEFIRMAGSIDGNMIAGMYNSSTTASDATLFTISQAGNSAGDPVLQLQVSGTGGNTTSLGVDNSDVNKFKITPNATLPGANANASFVGTNDAVPLWGINKDAPGHPLDVSGRMRSNEYLGVSTDEPTVGTLGTGLGTGPTINDVTGTNNGFAITFTTGTTPTAGGNMFTVTYATAYPGFAIPVFCANDDDAAADISKFTFNGVAGNAFTMKVRTGQTLAASTQYVLHFVVTGF